MQQEQTPKQVQPEDTETIPIEERDAKREFNSGSRGMDATVHDIRSTRRSVDLASSSNVDDPHWGLSFTEHKKTMGRIKKGNLYLNHMKVINPWENKNWILLAILMLYYWLAWLNASVRYALKKRTCRISFIYKRRWFSTRPQLQFERATCADA